MRAGDKRITVHTTALVIMDDFYAVSDLGREVDENSALLGSYTTNGGNLPFFLFLNPENEDDGLPRNACNKLRLLVA